MAVTRADKEAEFQRLEAAWREGQRRRHTARTLRAMHRMTRIRVRTIRRMGEAERRHRQ